jgi:hypothetical protein
MGKRSARGETSVRGERPMRGVSAGERFWAVKGRVFSSLYKCHVNL